MRNENKVTFSQGEGGTAWLDVVRAMLKNHIFIGTEAEAFIATIYFNFVWIIMNLSSTVKWSHLLTEL